MKKVLLMFLMFFISPVFATGISGTSAPCDNETLSKYNGTANIEINWEPNVIGISWYDGDKLINGPATCTYDETLTVPTAPTKLGYTFNGWKVMPLNIPNGYTKLEYIEATGNQYINTGIRQYHGTRVTFEFSLSPTKIGQNIWMGGNAYTQVEIISGNGFSVDNTSVIKVIFDGERETIYNNGVGKTSVRWGANNWNNLPILLFALGTSSGSNPLGSLNPLSGKLYYAKIYNENDETVRYFVPVRRNSDNVLGMWDTVSGQFFTNAGTGTFVAGPVTQ